MSTRTSKKRSSNASVNVAVASKKAKGNDESSVISSPLFSSTEHFAASPEWKESRCGTLLYLYPPSSPDSVKIAGFDIDDTIIKTKSGKAFATDDLKDWQLWSKPHVKTTLAELVSDGYRVVFFTNQEGISKGKVDKNKWKQKITDVITELSLTNQVTVLASLTKKENDYRKPHIGMWRFLCQHLSSPNATPNAEGSMYVGDAAGRPKRGSKKKDFSCTDFKFSLNIGRGLIFKTPEELFLKTKDSSDLASLTTSNMGFQPKVHWLEYVDKPFDFVNSNFSDLVSSCGKNGQEVIVIVGSPASGKSTIAGRLISGIIAANAGVEYVRVNQDTLKTVPKCIKATKEALADGKSVIIDNTNRDMKTRKNYIDVAESLKLPCRCVFVDATKEESFHMNALRGANGNYYGEKRTVPDMVVHSFYKNLVEPNKNEGFTEVIKLKVAPGPFDSEDQKSSFYRFTM